MVIFLYCLGIYPKIRGRYIADKFGWDVNEARKIWAFGPDAARPNVLLDATKAVHNMSDLKDSIVSAIQLAGPLATENVRGCRFNIEDITM